MADWFFNGFAKELPEALKLYNQISHHGMLLVVELWEMEPDRYGNRYVVITNEKVRGPPAKIKFVRKVKPTIEVKKEA